MAARITRAKKKIAVARIPYRVRAPRRASRTAARGRSNVVHLLFTAGHTAPSGPSLVRADLVERAMQLTRMLRELMPDEAEVRGLHALLLVTDARRATRADAAGGSSGSRTRTARAGTAAALAEAETLITGCLRAAGPGRYVLQAAIASLYAEAPAYEQTDWPQLVALYDELLRVWPSPVRGGEILPPALPGRQAADEGDQERLVGVRRVGGEDQAPELEGHRAVERRPDLLGGLDGVGGGDHAGRRGQLDDPDQRAEGRPRVLLRPPGCRARAGSRPRT